MSEISSLQNVPKGFQDLFNSLPEVDPKLYPEVSKEEAKFAAEELFKEETLADKIEKIPIKPVIGTYDLNEGDENARPKSVWRIAIEWLF